MCCLLWIIWSCVILTEDHFLILFSCISALGWGLPSRGEPFLAGGRGGTWLQRIPALPSLNVYFSAVTSRAFWDSTLAPAAFGLCSGRLFADQAGLSPPPSWLCLFPRLLPCDHSSDFRVGGHWLPMHHVVFGSGVSPGSKQDWEEGCPSECPST